MVSHTYIPAEAGQKACEFENSLGYIARSCLKTKTCNDLYNILFIGREWGLQIRHYLTGCQHGQTE